MKVAISYDAAPEPPDSVAFVEEALRVHEHEVVRADAGSVPDFALELMGIEGIAKSDVVFDISASPEVASLIDMLGVPRVGSSAFALSLACDVFRSRAVLRAHGLRVPPTWLAIGVTAEGRAVVTPDDALVFDGPGDFPLVVRSPIDYANASLHDVHDADALIECVGTVVEEHGAAVVEKPVEGREESVFVVGDVVLGEHPEPVSNAALRAFRAIGCRDYARVDVATDAAGEMYVVGVDPSPDVTDETLVRAARAHGWTFEQMIEEFVQMAARRGEGQA